MLPRDEPWGGKKKKKDHASRLIFLSEGEVTKLCPTLCDPMDCSLPGFSVHGIFQVRVLSGLPFLSPGDLPDPGIEPRSPALQADALPSEPPGKPKMRVNVAKAFSIKFLLLTLLHTCSVVPHSLWPCGL